MTTSYLNKVDSKTSVIGGNSITVAVGPDGVNYWAPKIVNVALSGVGLQRMNCTIYHGSTGDVGTDAYVDNTSAGQNDASGVISSQVVQPGEKITAVWTFPSPAQVFTQQITGIIRVYGETSDTPPTIGLAPELMGPHFSGKAASPVDRPRYLQAINFLNPGINQESIILPSVTSPQNYVAFDMEWTWSSTAPGSFGYFSIVGPVPGGGYESTLHDDPRSAGPRNMDFGGILIGNHLVYHQVGGDAAGTVACVGAIAYDIDFGI